MQGLHYDPVKLIVWDTCSFRQVEQLRRSPQLRKTVMKAMKAAAMKAKAMKAMRARG